MPTPSRILVVDDDEDVREALVELLDATGDYSGAACATLAEAKQALTPGGEPYAAVLLDVHLPDGDGCDMCAEWRRAGVGLPIIMVTGSDGEDEVVRGLAAGANDCLRKPVGSAALLARLRAAMRGFHVSGNATFAVGPYMFSPSARVLHEPSAKQRIRLTDKEARLLRSLLHADGGIVSRSALLQDVWGYAAASHTHTVESHVYRLRRKIEADPARATIVVTEPGGYRLGDSAVSAPRRRAARNSASG